MHACNQTLDDADDDDILRFMLFELKATEQFCFNQELFRQTS